MEPGTTRPAWMDREPTVADLIKERDAARAAFVEADQALQDLRALVRATVQALRAQDRDAFEVCLSALGGRHE